MRIIYMIDDGKGNNIESKIYESKSGSMFSISLYE